MILINSRLLFLLLHRTTIILEKQDNETFGFEIQVSKHWSMLKLCRGEKRVAFGSLFCDTFVSLCRLTGCSWKTALQWRCARLFARWTRTVLLRVLAWPQVSRPHPFYRIGPVWAAWRLTDISLTLICEYLHAFTPTPAISRTDVHMQFTAMLCNHNQFVPYISASLSFTGDIIVTVNGVSIEGSSHQCVLDQIRKSTNCLKWVTTFITS